MSTRSAIVTGASSGIGEATVRLLVSQGIPTLATGRSREKLKALETDYNGDVRRIATVAADVLEDGFAKHLFDEARAIFGLTPDIYILSAGIGLTGTLMKSKRSGWARLINVNYIAALDQMRDCLELWSGGGGDNVGTRDLVVIGSTVGRQISTVNPVYGSTKFALHALVEGLRQEVCHNGIRVTLIEPGFVLSGFQVAADYDMSWFRSVETESGPLLRPEDVARVIDFVIRSPAHVHIDDVRIRPTRQKV
jgi:NADP-dependent 3-hydroxy acid dehydrogenase YdfG